MLDYNTYLLVMTVPLMLGGVFFWFCESTQRVLFDNGNVAFHEDCCCCEPCSSCDNNPPPYGWISFSGVVATNPVDCTDCATFNSTSFDVTCAPLAPCKYTGSVPFGDYCYYDDLSYRINDGSDNFEIIIEDDEPDPLQQEIFTKAGSYPVDCEATQGGLTRSGGLADGSCDFSGATASFDPYCF